MLLNKIFISLFFIAIFPMIASSEVRPGDESTILAYGKLMSVAYQIGKEIGYPETIQGLLLQETKGGRYRGPNKAAQNHQSYGVMQIKLSTAKFVLSKIWGLPKSDLPPDCELRRKIRDDDVLNIKIAASYFKYLLSLYSGPTQWAKAVLSYNIGPYRFHEDFKDYDPDRYVVSVLRMIKTDVRKFNSINNLN